MTREEAKKLLPYVQAFADGKLVQWQDSVTNEWHDDNDPNFHPVAKWRIKPEPREVWITICNLGEIGCVFREKQLAKEWIGNSTMWRIVKFREVVDE